MVRTQIDFDTIHSQFIVQRARHFAFSGTQNMEYNS